MALINIEYGSLASSETMNKNFLYLEDKITESSSSIMTSISSILSNIATINTNLSDLAETVNDYVEEFNTTLTDYKDKTKLLVNSVSMVPNWAGCYTISLATEFNSPSNGYLLILPETTSTGIISINGILSFNIKEIRATYDNSSQLISIPVKKGDKISCSIQTITTYFLPASEINIENF